MLLDISRGTIDFIAIAVVLELNWYRKGQGKIMFVRRYLSLVWKDFPVQDFPVGLK